MQQKICSRMVHISRSTIKSKIAKYCWKWLYIVNKYGKIKIKTTAEGFIWILLRTFPCISTNILHLRNILLRMGIFYNFDFIYFYFWSGSRYLVEVELRNTAEKRLLICLFSNMAGNLDSQFKTKTYHFGMKFHWYEEDKYSG